MHDTKRHNGRHNGRHWKHCDMSNMSDMSISFAQVSATNVALNLEGHLRPVLQLYQVSHTTKVNGWMVLICGFTWFHSWTPSFVRVTNLGQDSIGGLWRFVMGCHALWWFVMGCDALWWFVTVSDGLWWVVTACAGLWWFQFGRDGLWWVAMGCDGLWWLMMVSVGLLLFVQFVHLYICAISY